MSQKISNVIKLERKKKNKLVEFVNDNIDSSLRESLKHELDQDYISIDLLMKIKKCASQNSDCRERFFINDWIIGAELFAPKLEPAQKVRLNSGLKKKHNF